MSRAANQTILGYLLSKIGSIGLICMILALKSCRKDEIGSNANEEEDEDEKALKETHEMIR